MAKLETKGVICLGGAMKKPYFQLVGLIVVMLFLTGQALAAGPVGYTQQVVGEVLAFQDDSSRTLRNKSPVYQRDTIVTRSGGKTQIMFADGTQLSIAPESMIELAAYEYSPAFPGADILKFILGPGFFRLITGKMVQRNPERFNVNTPYGTLGIRGTQTASMVEIQGGSNAALVNAVGSAADARSLFEGLPGMDLTEEHAHLVKTGGYGLYYTFGRTQQTSEIPVARMIMVSRDGVSEPRGISNAMARSLAKTVVDPDLQTPEAFDTVRTIADLAANVGNNSDGADLKEKEKDEDSDGHDHNY